MIPRRTWPQPAAADLALELLAASERYYKDLANTYRYLLIQALDELREGALRGAAPNDLRTRGEILRYTYFVAAGCLTLLLSTQAGARPTNDPAPVLSNMLNVQLASTELPLSKPDHKKDKKHHEKKHEERERRGHQTPLPNDDYRDDSGPNDPAPTPEPGTLLLLGAAAGAAGLRRRFRNRTR